MSLDLKPGTRLFGAACTSEFIVVKAPAEPVDLRIGGHPALTSVDDRSGGLEVTTDPDDKPAMGKRYVDDDETIEVLCTKPGDGGVSIGATSLQLKDAKALPASD